MSLTECQFEILRNKLNGSHLSQRALSKAIGISIGAVNAGCQELEKEGFIYTIAGKGCFVAPKNTELLREENLRKIEEHMSEIIRLSHSCGLSGEELLDMLRYEMEE